ncbi:unnamed protein product [Caenorhabditis auriculariae]|uniref:SH2 domain-containing protein n=1 Tax=Caenorhabditis auriculariae TaxID=2777116 RepID=A0A8S1HEP6_9PELO|nr:unnamed protein product [Caenorhabditis auriculariae]
MKRNSSRKQYVPTIPDYSVEEDRHGRLVNKEKRLIWPSKEPVSPESFREFMSDPKATPPASTKPASRRGRSESTTASSVDSSTVYESMASSKSSRKTPALEYEKIASSKNVSYVERPVKQSGSTESNAFIGGATSAEAEGRIGSRSFILYYRLPDTGKLQLHLPLMLVYRSSTNEHYHFMVSRRNLYLKNGEQQKTFWRVECGDVNSREFLTIEALIRHYETFVYHDAKTGNMETFPVGRNIIFDVFQ